MLETKSPFSPAKGGFKFSKRQSNAKKLCEKDSDVETVTALGLQWNLRSDDLKISCGSDNEDHIKISHRVVLSTASSFFDLLGLVFLFAFRVRLILRLVWKKALKHWDEEYPQDISKQYLDWLQEFPALKRVSVSGRYGWQHGSKVHLHVFADASDIGLCVVADRRIEVDDEN